MPSLVNDLQSPVLGGLNIAAEPLPVSVIILAWDEEQNLAACLESCAWCDEVHVLDAGMTDRTREIAEAQGAHVHQHPLVSFADQRNWAIDHIQTRHPWQFHLNADERFTPQLVNEIRKQLAGDGTAFSYVAYQVPTKTMFMDKWLRHGGVYPKYQVRLFRVGRCRFVDFANTEREEVRGEVGSLVQPYLHFCTSNGMAAWFYKHNRYSSVEADIAVEARAGKINLPGLFSRDSMTRKKALRDLTYHLRWRGFLRFMYMYIVRAGWLDATPGFHYCALIATYEYWVELKIREHDLNWSRRTTELAHRLLNQPAVKRGS